MAFWTHKFKNPLFLNKAGDTEESSRVRWSKFPHIPIYIPKTHLSLSLLCVFLALFTNSFGFLRMELDPDDVFRDDEDDADNELYRVFTFSLFSFCCESWVLNFDINTIFLYQEKESTKELLVYLVNASPKMFSASCPSVSFLTWPPPISLMILCKHIIIWLVLEFLAGREIKTMKPIFRLLLVVSRSRWRPRSLIDRMMKLLFASLTP